jgi:hypothetical protein
MTALTGRYTNSPETIMEQDLARLRDIKDATGFIAFLDCIISDTLTEDYWNITLPNELATSLPRSPSLFAYYAAMNLLDARVLFSKMKVSELLDPAMKARKSAIERHHPMFKGSECLYRFLGLRALHTTRSRGPVRHRSAGDGAGHQRSVQPLAHLSIVGPVLLV